MMRRMMALALAASLALPAVAHAQTPPPPRIVVTGEGEATAAPDLALLSLSVMREAKTAREALDANNDAMAAVIAAMKSAGIEERDLQTAGIQISPRYNYTNKPDGTPGSRTRRLPGHQHAFGAHPRHRQDRRDPRQIGIARRQPGRRHLVLQRGSNGNCHRSPQEGGRRRHGQGQDAG